MLHSVPQHMGTATHDTVTLSVPAEHRHKPLLKRLTQPAPLPSPAVAAARTQQNHRKYSRSWAYIPLSFFPTEGHNPADPSSRPLATLAVLNDGND
jgi:hypothetical protein